MAESKDVDMADAAAPAAAAVRYYSTIKTTGLSPGSHGAHNDCFPFVSITLQPAPAKSGPAPPRFEIKKWNAVAMWSWDICADTVSIAARRFHGQIAKHS